MLANASGNLKKSLKPSDLYTPRLSYDRPRKKTAKDEAEAKRALKEEIERLAALSPPPS